MRRSQNLALRSVQFLAHFTSFYFEILSYLACGEKIIRLESKNSVKLDEKSSDMLQDTPFLLSLYIYKIFRGMRGGGGRGRGTCSRLGACSNKYGMYPQTTTILLPMLETYN